MKISLLFISLALIILLASCSSNTIAPTLSTSPTRPPASTPFAQPTNTSAPPTSSQTTQPTQTSGPTNTNGGTAMQWSTPPALAIDQNKTYTATMDTNYGQIVIQLFPKDAPLTVNSFVFLSRQKFYDGVKFHRIVKGFVIQGGDPTGTGSGGPGYKFADEKITRDYVAGTLAMANAGPNTNGSQFFICLADLTGGRLPKNYTIFGLVTAGMDVVQKIGNLPTTVNPSSGENSKPTVEVKINTLTITEK
jgi:cyclophilin family peptidyl-prolyl cis-trans isomerase